MDHHQRSRNDLAVVYASIGIAAQLVAAVSTGLRGGGTRALVPLRPANLYCPATHVRPASPCNSRSAWHQAMGASSNTTEGGASPRRPTAVMAGADPWLQRHGNRRFVDARNCSLTARYARLQPGEHGRSPLPPGVFQCLLRHPQNDVLSPRKDATASRREPAPTPVGHIAQ